MDLKNIFKKNQIIVYTMALMLVAAGYLNYTNNMKNSEIETSVQEVEKENNEIETDKNNKESEETNNNETALVPNTEMGTNVNTQNIINSANNTTVSLNTKTEENQKIAGIGDAMLVNSNDVVEDEYFVKSKIERDAMYSQMQETYQTILNSPNSLESQKEMASVEMAKINETKNCIMICENLLETKGFKNCVIFVNEESVSVIVGCKELKPDQTAQIQNIISREIGAIVENIHISVK